MDFERKKEYIEEPFNKCLNCKCFELYYKMGKDSYMPAIYGWCDKEHNNVYINNYCNSFDKKEEKEIVKKNIEKSLLDVMAKIVDIYKIIQIEMEEK